MDEIESAILAEAPTTGSVELHRLLSACARRLVRALGNYEFNQAVARLRARGLVIVDQERIKLNEPDWAEAKLEDGVEGWLRGPECLTALNVDDQSMVFRRTTVGGAAGTGTYSRPDFTMAVIRRLKFDPMRRLDVVTFELKNLAGAGLVAVHEALAHTRFGHYSHLVCPRSSLNEARTQEIRTACAMHGLGLILFTVEPNTQVPHLSNFRLDLPAVRQSPDPYVVQSYLEARLAPEEQERLIGLART